MRTDPRLLHNIADVSGQKFYADNEITRLDLLKSISLPCLSSVDALFYVTLPPIYIIMNSFSGRLMIIFGASYTLRLDKMLCA